VLQRELENILEHKSLSSWFQPIADLRKEQILGYEATVRGPSESPLHSPLILFDAAARHGFLREVEHLSRKVHIERWAELGLPGKLFINITPQILIESDYPSGVTMRFLRALGLSPENLIIELTEQQPVEDYDLMRRALDHYREMGFAVALDDVGAGYAGLRHWSELRPDYVKFDRHFIQGIHEDETKQQFIASMHEIALYLGCKAIAEGVEVEEEFQTVRSLGIPFAQGYYFARPQPAPSRHLAARLFMGESLTLAPGSQRREGTSVGSLLKPSPCVDSKTRVSLVGEIFAGNLDLWSLPIVDGGRPLGMVHRHDFLNLYSSRYGRDLYGREPAGKLTDIQALVVDRHMAVEEASRLITGRDGLRLTDSFIVTEEGCYQGIVTVNDLLRAITELQLKRARHANPLTQLPGNLLINEHLEQCLSRCEDFTLCYCDLDNFKSYNDCYGYGRGDGVIRLLARILQEGADTHRDFVGHIGGDDFIVVFKSRDWEERCRQILEQFAREILEFYSPEARSAGGIRAADRKGRMQFHPLVSLSIGAVRPRRDLVSCVAQLADMASQAKKQAKHTPGNHLFIERRFCEEEPSEASLAEQCCGSAIC